jgi:hypothetical protein
MKKLFTLIAPFAIAGSLMVGISSCKDDKEEPRISTVTFANASKTVGEGETNIEAKITLDQPAETDIVINYTLGGSAVRKIGAIAGDFQVVGDVGEVEIPAGQSSASIVLDILQDNVFEESENIVITLDDANVSTVEIGSTDEMIITIQGGVKVTATFSQAAKTAGEGESAVEAKVVLDQPAETDLTLTYTLGGTAVRKIGSAAGDYEVTGTVGEVVIPAGQNTASIMFNILDDALFELSENIVLTLGAGTSSAVQIGTQNQMTISILANGQVTVSFTETSLTVNESQAGTHDIAVTIPAAIGSDVVVSYTLSPWFQGDEVIQGAAIDSVTAYQNEVPQMYYDYWIDGTAGQVTIPAGQTSGLIKVFVTSDLNAEFTEEFSITLTQTTDINVGANSTIEVTVEQEDGLLIELGWGPEAGGAYEDVDMDMFLWAENSSGTLQLTSIAGINADTEGPESIFLPDVLIEDGTYGLSYNYYEGTADPMHFMVIFAELKDGELEAEADFNVFEADYTLDNINPWDTSGDDPILVQTFDRTSGAYVNFSDIDVPAEGSRARSGKLPKGLARTLKMPYKTRLIK